MEVTTESHPKHTGLLYVTPTQISFSFFLLPYTAVVNDPLSLSPNWRQKVNAHSQRCFSGSIPCLQEFVGQRRLVEYFEGAVAFAKQIHEVVPFICDLLSSTASSDVVEAV